MTDTINLNDVVAQYITFTKENNKAAAQELVVTMFGEPGTEGHNAEGLEAFSQMLNAAVEAEVATAQEQTENAEAEAEVSEA